MIVQNEAIPTPTTSGQDEGVGGDDHVDDFD
jgi:hypothetical protein